MEGARLTGGAAPTFLPAAAGRAGSRLAYEPSVGSVRAAGSGPGDLVPERRRRRTRQPGSLGQWPASWWNRDHPTGERPTAPVC
jgi:hypothetical protein